MFFIHDSVWSEYGVLWYEVALARHKALFFG